MEFGVNPIWFGVFLILMVELGQLTPPVGMNVLTVQAVVRDIPSGKIFRGVAPFLLANVFVVTTIIIFPELVTYPSELVLI